MLNWIYDYIINTIYFVFAIISLLGLVFFVILFKSLKKEKMETKK